jgi:signal transduction histidine kinase
MLANNAAVAITNARQFRDLSGHDRIMTRRFESQELLNKLASTLDTSTDIDQIVDNGLTQLMDYLQLKVGEVFLRQEDSKNLVLKRHIGGKMNNLWRRQQYLIGEGIIGKAARSGTAEVLDLAEKTYPDLDPLIKSHRVYQIAVTPLNGRSGVLGVMCTATSHPRQLDDLESQFLQAIASWMATAIENVRLNLSDRRLAVLEERERFGMDLHDGIIQSVYAVGLTLEHARLLLNNDPEMAASRIDQAIHDLNSTIRDIRAYILDLRPRQMHNESIMQGIQRLVHEFKANTLIEVNLDGPADGLETLPEEQAVALFHICQESLANIAKHAHARHVEVLLWKTNDRALLEIHDDGQGFNPDQIRKAIGHGLSNMQTRATNVGGEVDITSEVGAGSTVLAWVPLPDQESTVTE